MVTIPLPRTVSPYYPPRARWYGAFLYPVDSLRRRLALDRLQMPEELKLGALIAGLLVPGLAFYFRAPWLFGKTALAVAAALFLIFVARLGHAEGNLVFGMLLSLHVSGLVYYYTPLLDLPLKQRLAFTLLVLIGLTLLVYLPAREFLQRYGITPLELNGELVIVHHVYSTRSIHAGDWMAYRLEGNDDPEGRIYALSGIDLAPVLAVPGDRIEFFATTFRVNGVAQPRLAHMPTSGSYSVPEKQWFIWPNLDIHGHGHVSEQNLSGLLFDMARVSQGQLIGKPFQSWFGHRQKLS